MSGIAAITRAPPLRHGGHHLSARHLGDHSKRCKHDARPGQIADEAIALPIGTYWFRRFAQVPLAS